MKRYKYKVSLKELQEEFEMIYQDLYKNYICDLEKKRNKIKWKKILQYIFYPIFFVFLFLVQFGALGASVGSDLIICGVGIASFSILIISSSRLDLDKREYRRIYKNKVIPQFMKLINDKFKFRSFDNELFKMREEYKMAGFHNRVISYDSNDYAGGEIDNGTLVKICDVNVKFIESEEKSMKKTFKGLFSYIKWDNEIDTVIKISKNKLKILEQENRVKMDSMEFEKYFDIYSENKILAMQILTSDVMEILTSFYKKYSLAFEIIFKNNTIYMRFFTGPMFEPKIFRKSMNKKILALYFCILKFIADLSESVNKSLKGVEV